MTDCDLAVLLPGMGGGGHFTGLGWGQFAGILDNGTLDNRQARGCSVTMPSEFTYDVFLSHNSKDKPRVRKLAERLRDAGLRVWFDEWVIRPGDDIYLAIEHGLEAARVQVLCLSPAALGSDWVKLERSTVLFRDPSNAGRRFVPLLLADCKLPDTLRRYKYVDFREETQGALEELVSACRHETGLQPPVPRPRAAAAGRLGARAHGAQGLGP